MGIVIFGDGYDASGFLVEPMDNAWAQRVFWLVAAGGEALAAAEQCVDESALGIPCSGVDVHASGLVHKEKVVVFKEDVKRNRFGLGANRRTLASFDLDAFAAMQLLRGLCGTAVDEDETRVDQFLDASAGKLGALGDNPAVEAGAAIGVGREEFVLGGLGSHRVLVAVPR